MGYLKILFNSISLWLNIFKGQLIKTKKSFIVCYNKVLHEKTGPVVSFA